MRTATHSPAGSRLRARRRTGRSPRCRSRRARSARRPPRRRGPRLGSDGRPARLDRPDVLDRVVLGDLEQPLEHRGRRIEGDDRTAGRIERTGDRQREPPRARPDIEPRVARPDELEERGQDRIVAPGRVGPEERVDRRVEVRPVGDLADPLDLLAIGPDPGRPRCLDRRATRSSRVSTSGFAPTTGTSATSSGWAARTGPRPRSPVASATSPKAGRRRRTGLRPRSSS